MPLRFLMGIINGYHSVELESRQKVRSSSLSFYDAYDTGWKFLSLASPLKQLAVLSNVFFINAPAQNPAQNLYLLVDVCCAVEQKWRWTWWTGLCKMNGCNYQIIFFPDAIIKMNSNQRSAAGTLCLMFALWYETKEISLHFEAPRGTTCMHDVVSMEYKPSAPNVRANWCRNPNVRVQWGWTVSKDLLRWITAQNMNIS